MTTEKMITSTNRVILEGITHLLKTRRKSKLPSGDYAYGDSGCFVAPSIKPEYRQLMDYRLDENNSTEECFKVKNILKLTEGTVSPSAAVILQSIYAEDWARDCDLEVVPKLQHIHDNAAYDEGKLFLKEVLTKIKEVLSNTEYTFPENAAEFLGNIEGDE